MLQRLWGLGVFPFSFFLFPFSFFLFPSAAVASDWLHWRGPLENGYSPEKNLPDEWDPRVAGKNNLIWKQPYGCRSTPLIMSGRVYIIGADNDPLGVPTVKEKPLIGERVTCFDAKTGEKKWEQTFNIFHADIVANRLGWAPLAGDAVNKRIYAHSSAGFLYCFDAESGKIVWQRQLTEEFGRVTGYGGRIGGGPTFDSGTGLVYVGIVNGSWGNQGIGMNRFFAFDGKDGKLVWSADTPFPLRITYYSNPVVAVINGERLLITGGADGGLHAYQARTGKRVWSLPIATGVINPSPVVDGDLIYIAHGEDNIGAESKGPGGVICVDGSKIVNGKPTVVWEFKKGIRFGLASLGLAEGKLYVPYDGARLYCFDAKDGRLLWKYNYGTAARGAPLIADGKIYISETSAKFHIIKLKEDGTLPDDGETHTIKFDKKPGASGAVESNCTPAVADGCVFLASRDELFCIGKGGKPDLGKWPPTQVEKPAGENDPVAQILIVPSDISLAPGETGEFELLAFNAKGQSLKNAKLDAKWSLPLPPLPKGATAQPPALDAQLDPATGKIVINPKKPSQQAYLDAKVGELTARCRVRVVPQIPYKQDFKMVPVGAVPGGWVNAQGKYRVVEIAEGEQKVKALLKVNTSSKMPVALARAYMTAPSSTDYTVQSDIKGVAVRGELGDMGVIANRYVLIMDGKTIGGKRAVRLTTWEALPTPLPAGRVAKELSFTWKENIWYRVKLTVELRDKDAVIRGKIWERDQPEPSAWTVELTDPRPNREGAAALYGYISDPTVNETNPGPEIYYANVSVTPNGKK